MRGKILGQEASSLTFPVVITQNNLDLLNTVIDTVHASKEALLQCIKENPAITEEGLRAKIVEECHSIAKVNDHFAIGLPMNSFRFTLHYLMIHYLNDLVPEIPHVGFRLKELERFVMAYEEIALVFPEVFGTEWHVGDLSFSVKSFCNKPTFVHFVKPNLHYATGYFLKDPAVVKQFSEQPK